MVGVATALVVVLNVHTPANGVAVRPGAAPGMRVQLYSIRGGDIELCLLNESTC